MFDFVTHQWIESARTIEYGGNIMSDWASSFRGLMVNTQHRFYDGVPPTNTANLGESLKYLSSVQALADAARVVEQVNRMYAPRLKSPLKWIVMSGSYGGNMAAWFRLRYPHLSVGAVAISGPVEALVDYSAFFAVDGANMRPECLANVRAAVRELESYLETPSRGWNKVQSDFNVTFFNELDVSLFMFDLAWGSLSSGALCRANNATSPYNALVSTFQRQNRNRQLIYRYSAEKVYSLYSVTWYRQTCVCPPSSLSSPCVALNLHLDGCSC